MKIILVFAMVVGLSAATLVGMCNKCFDNYVACENETNFRTCLNNKATATIIKCPNGRVCTNDWQICGSLADNYKPICYNVDYCGKCEPTNGVFACLNETAYGYCFGNTTPSESTIRSCPPGFVCNYDSLKVCVPESSYKPSCVPLQKDAKPIQRQLYQWKHQLK